MQLRQSFPSHAARFHRIDKLEKDLHHQLKRKRRLSTLHTLGPITHTQTLRVFVHYVRVDPGANTREQQYPQQLPDNWSSRRGGGAAAAARAAAAAAAQQPSWILRIEGGLLEEGGGGGGKGKDGGGLGLSPHFFLTEYFDRITIYLDLLGPKAGPGWEIEVG